jgi:CYTH domain-containing protein
MVQGYLNASSGRTVRVRTAGDRGFITIKAAAGTSRISRHEWEYEIPGSDAREIMALCVGGVIDKTRHYVPYAGHIFEVDVFHGENEGLVLAEVELASENEVFDRPAWLGEEVTGDARYYNSMLMKNPYRRW